MCISVKRKAAHISVPQTSSLPLAVQDSWTTTGTDLLHCCVSNMDPSLPGASLSSCHCGCCCCCCCVETTKGGVGKSPSITRGGRLVEHFAVQSLMEGWMRFYILLHHADYLQTSLLRHIGCCHKGQESKTKALSHLVTVY